MKRFFITISLAVLALVSCTQRETYDPCNTVISASFEQDVEQTKLSISDDNALIWTEQDAFMMFGNGSSAKFVLTSGQGSTNGTFSGVLPAEVRSAAYPWENDYRPSLLDDILTMNLPAVLDQTSIGKCNLPMYANVSSVQSISFKHLAGVMRIRFSDIPVGYNSLTIKASNPISGIFTADVSKSDPVLVSSSSEAVDKEITINFTAATTEDNDKVLYIPLPVGTYTYIEVLISNGTDTKELITYTDKTVERAKIYTANLTISDVDAETPSTEDALLSAIEKGGNVTLSNDITLSNYIEVRSTVVLDLNGHTLLHPSSSSATYKDVFEVFGEGNLTIKGEGKVIAEDGYSVYAAGDSKVTIDGGYYFSPVSVVDARKNAQVLINAGTFKVDGSNNTDGDFGHVYTLNLRDKKGSYAGDQSSITVKGGKFYKYDPSSSESESPIANFVAPGYSSVQEGDYYVVSEGIKNERALVTAIELVEAGQTIKLMGDIALTDALVIPADKNITLDLNGHNLTGSYTGADHYAMFTIPNGASMTVTGDGNVSAVTDVTADNRSLALFLNHGNLTLKSGTYNMENTGNSHTWIIATIVDNRTNSKSCATKLTIDGGTYSVSGEAINLFRNYPQQGGSATLIINGGLFKSNNGATTYIWNQESGSYLGELYFNGGTYETGVVYEDYNGQSDVHIAVGVNIQGYSGNN